MVICNVAKILELVVPLMEHPSETFLATIEEDLMKLIIKHGMTVCASGFQVLIIVKIFLLRFFFLETLLLFCVSLGCSALCELPWSCCKQSHSQLQVCHGLLQQVL